MIMQMLNMNMQIWILNTQIMTKLVVSIVLSCDAKAELMDADCDPRSSLH